MRQILTFIIAHLITLTCGWSQPASTLKPLIDAAYPALATLYRNLHENPELSTQEANTAAKLQTELSARGFEVTGSVGGHGFVAVLKNGPGRTLLIRTDLDALPLKENTQLPYASQATTTDEGGNEVGVMHACGHDIHMSALIGVAEMMVALKSDWQGTLLLIGQPAEEIGAGAQAMLGDGLFERFPLPDYALAFHVAADLEAGRIGYRPGYLMANVDSVDISIQGRGGHGAAPQQTIDPVVIAAQTVLALQTIVSREIDPLESAVITVGHLEAGTKRNIIPDTALLQLTVRSYSDATRKRLLDSIKRIAVNTARAAGVSEENLPIVTTKDAYTPAVYNDPDLTERLAKVWRSALGSDSVVLRDPEMIGEDFARYGLTKDDIPISMFRIGTAEVTADGIQRQSLHSAEFAPVLEPSLKGAVLAMTLAALDLLQPASNP